MSILFYFYFILSTAAPTKWLAIVYILSEFLQKIDIKITIVAVSKHKFIVLIIKFVKESYTLLRMVFYTLFE